LADFRLALQETTRDRVPLDWADTQMNLGNALQALGEREAGTERLEEAVAAPGSLPLLQALCCSWLWPLYLLGALGLALIR
jgi:hypothetical protein